MTSRAAPTLETISVRPNRLPFKKTRAFREFSLKRRIIPREDR
jgi:hypothetical protein